ncbi:uncharacterized protein LOC125954470 [Anopheles darlingi]|uniref:uncharacterized protein LOC125954470 n=1 Tax=Anopheles darlingi TaxID=43151 RepID=UPI0021001754|nr:uncharacterized protein LOC125954470 [Anopheles darlingi]
MYNRELLLLLLTAQARLQRLKHAIEDQRRVRRRRLRRKWMKPIFINRAEHLKDDIMAEVEKTKVLLRMSEEDFQWLLTSITPKIQKEDTTMRQAISPLLRISIALRFLATGDMYSSLQYTFLVSTHTIARVVPEVCDAIVETLKDFVKMPSTTPEWLQIADEFEQEWNFPHAIGAIDGKQVVLRPQRKKPTYSIVLLAIVDANYNFIYANIECQETDGDLLASTALERRRAHWELSIPLPRILRVPYSVEVPYMFLGDESVALSELCLIPYSKVPLRQRHERTFNYRHSRARRVVENAFGVLSVVFRCLRTALELQPAIAKKVVLCCVHLHNFLRKSNSAEFYTPSGTFDREENEDQFIPGMWRNDLPAESMLNLEGFARNSPRKMDTIRDLLARELFFNSPLE